MDNHPPQPPASNGSASTNTGKPALVNGTELQEESTIEWVESIPNGTIFAYNLDDSKTPGGLKVRFKIRVVSGPEATRVDARQAEAIKELLQWACQHPPRRRS
jgi:hypothetical protein